jgi:2-haloacid dehalogenase
MLPSNDVEDIASEFMRLRLFPDVREALRALPARRAILSNGSQKMLNALVSHAGLAEVFEVVISVDAARAFKPHPNCYALVEAVMNVPRRDVVFVSSNGFDITGAKRFGFAAIWVNRAPPEDAIAPVEPSQLYRLLRTQPERLGEIPDRTCASLGFLPEAYRIDKS